MNDVFFEIHRDNDREGPGSFASTRRAFSLIHPAPDKPRILDAGCGPGAQTLDLAQLTDGTIIAVDNHPPYVEELDRKIREAGLSDRVNAALGDMFGFEFPEQSFDVIWSEGAIYIIGFERGLREWRPLLKPGGSVVVSEITWLRPDVPSEVAEFWNGAYPAMSDIAGNVAALERAGYDPLGRFVIPESAWWESYYGPIEKKLARLRQTYCDDPEALAVLDEEQREIDLFRNYSSYYGYVFYAGRLV